MTDLVIILSVALGIHLTAEVICWWSSRHINGRRRGVTLRAIFSAVLAPLRLAIWVLAGSWIADIYFPDFDWTRVRIAIVVVLGTWLILRVRNRIVSSFAQAHQQGQVWAEPTQIEVVGKLIALGGWIFFLLGLFHLWGVDYRALLTFSGIGALAVGFAGQQVFSNFFSGCVIYATSPFRLGDHISSPDRSLEGRVEHIGWYMTCLRVKGGEPLYVPNSIFTSVTILNLNRKSHD